MERDHEAAGDETMKAGIPPQRTFASGRYIVERVLGEGGQKLVFLVHDLVLDRDCALSVIKSEMLEPEDLKRLQREGQTMARLGAHSNIVTVLDMGEEGGKPYLVCEYVPAGDLGQELRKAAGPLPLNRALSIASDIARALTIAHARGVIHRDIKPANVWLCDDGSAKLGDFGLAFSINRSRLTVPYSVMGTAAYMSPEQARGEPVTESSDLYSLGALLFEMVTGRPPFVDDNVAAVIAQLLNVEPAAPSSLNLRVPLSLDALILQLLAKSAAVRPQNAVRLSESLRVITDELRKARTAAPSLAISSTDPAPVARAQPKAIEDSRFGRQARGRSLVVGVVMVFAAAATAAFIAGFLIFGDNGDPEEAGVLETATTPNSTATPQRITAVSTICGAACSYEFVLAPEVDESGLKLAFEVTYRSDLECPGVWGSDDAAAAAAVANGLGDTFAVVDRDGVPHRVTRVGGQAASSDDLPCNEQKAGWWHFGPVPAGPAAFHYLNNFEQPPSFVVPETAQAPTTPPPDQE